MLKALLRSVFLWLIIIAAVSAETVNAILISLDGARRERLYSMLAADKLPALFKMKTNGALVEINIEGHQTETGPGHAQMLTGLPKEVTNVYTNSKYDAIPEGLTIGERLGKALGKDNIVTIMVMGKTVYMGARSPAEFTEKETEEWWGTMTQPYINAKKNIDVWDGDETKVASVVGARALGYLDKYKKKRFFMFLHFKDTDAEGHTFGESSRAYEAAFTIEDAWIGKIIEKLRELKLYDKTLIYVTADHGFDKGQKSHLDAPEIFLVTNDKTVNKNGTQADIVPTILTQFNVDLSKLEPKLPGNPLNR